MRPADWRPYAARVPYRDALTCAGCGAVKAREAKPVGWSRRYLPKERRTEARCPRCSAAVA